MAGTVTITVHEREDAAGFVVRVVLIEDGRERIARFPTATREEADALHASIVRLAETGSVEALLPQENDR